MLLIFWPLVAAVGLLVMKPKQGRMIAFVSSVAELFICLGIMYSFDENASTQFEVNYPWLASRGISFHAGIDGISLLLVFLTCLLMPFIILSSPRPDDKPVSFYSLILLMEMALIGVFTVLDGFVFYIFWELALIPIYIISLRWGGENRGSVTLKFFIYTLAGSLIMLVAMVYVYLQTPTPHSFDVQSLYSAAQQLTSVKQDMIFWAMFVAFAIKMPVFPFHTWQPDTYDTAPIQGTMLLSGIMLKMGIYGLIRWLIPMVPLGISNWGTTAIILSVIGIVYASCIAIVQKDLKRLLAYSSIAHVGLIASGIFTLDVIGIQGAMIQMISHGVVIVGLFFLVNVIIDRTGTQVIEKLGGIRLTAPKFTTVFIILLLGSVALPLTSGFIGEFLLINAVFQYDRTIGAFAGLTMILGAVYMLRSFQKTMLGEESASSKQFFDLTFQEKAVIYPLVLLVIGIGVFPSPLLKLSATAVENILTIVSNYQALSN
jgi:NADH-quinone oxidoreductase subunit M